MIRIDGPFPLWLFRGAPLALFVCGVVVGGHYGSAIQISKTWHEWALWIFFVVSIGFCNGATDAMLAARNGGQDT